MKLCNFMVNLGALSIPEKTVIFSNIGFYSEFADLTMILRLYYNVLILDTVWLHNKDFDKKFYYNYYIATNFYKTKDEETGFDHITVFPTKPSGIKIFLGRYYI